jgi:tagaturonate reductase
MKKLNNSLLDNGFAFPVDLKVGKSSVELPDRVIQFGEGNFLRAFADWMIHGMNEKGLFNGRVVVVQPIADGLVELINQQDGLYTLLSRGLQDGKPTETKEIISSISRGINPYTDWPAYLACAEKPDIEFVISNTTEAGIVFDKNDRLENTPPVSFPGKLTAYLYHRYTHFQGKPDKGMVIIPCELIDRNGDTLKKVVLELTEYWGLPERFRQWVLEYNYFLNTLVDRVVTGYPRDEIKTISAHLGYEDQLVDTGELFHLWVIEGPQELSARLPLTQAGFNVIWTSDMTPYRTRKVRILNGAHTSSVPAAFLYGLETVVEMMDHKILSKYVQQIIYDEIIPSIDLEREMLVDFADSVVERFQNPFIKHYLLSILLNSTSKFRARVLPSLLDYHGQFGKLPEKLTFSLAALVAVYKDGQIEKNSLLARREIGEFTMKDDLPVLVFMTEIWRGFTGDKPSAVAVARQVLANTDLWGQDLNAIPGLTEKVGGYLYRIATDGMRSVVESLVD